MDEADRMLDMGFLPDVRRILKRLPAERQNLLFSATMPDDIRRLASEILRQPVTVQVDHTVPLDTVSHALYPVNEHLKSALLARLLEEMRHSTVLVFTRTKHRAKRLAKRLHEQGWGATSLQGNLSQNKRKAAIDGFRDGKYDILVATDIASRGIDISQITHVVNFDVPDTTDAYTHRIGRTGRAAKTGDALTFVTPEDEAMVRDIERAHGARLERRKVSGFDYSARQTANPPKHRNHGRPAQSAPASRPPGTPVPGRQPSGGFHGGFRGRSSRSRFHKRRRR